jgi:hypothetical protein
MTEKESKTLGKKKGKKTKEEIEITKEEIEKETKETKETKKKGSKLIPKTKIQEEGIINICSLNNSNELENKKKDNIFPIEPEPALPNVVVRLRCQLSDLNRPIVDENQISNPYEYKAWVPSEIKTYNTTDFQASSLSMEPIHFMNMETINRGGNGDGLINLKETNITEENKECGENYAYLDAKWLHSGMMNKINMNDATPMLKQMIQPSGLEMDSIGIDKGEVGKKRDGEGIIRSSSFMGESSEYSKAPISKDIQNKLYQQKVLLYHGLVQNQKKSACFWCTCDYDTPACAIPYYNVDGSLDGYGSFCRPECAVAYLYSEKLDDSVRADRDHLINFYYGKAYGYEKRIKPAPDPHYLLDKFFGNLTIQEYRKLLKSEHLLATLEKPMTRIFPELHEITDDFLIQIYGGDITLNRGYRVKRASEQVKGPSKMEILRDQFKKPAEKGT